MAYSINPNLPKARAFALKLLIIEKLPLLVVANKCGVHRSTVWRWKRKWDKLNECIQRDNPNRPSRAVGISKLARCSWSITTEPSRPHTNPSALSEQIVACVLRVRQQLKRCAEVVWHHLTHILSVCVSLSSVRRILKRHHCFDGARKKRVQPDNPRRPRVTEPGELVETDTIHHVDPDSGKRLYYYTVIDLYTRMTYAEIHPSILPGLAAQVILHARNKFGFDFTMVQADNGLEFSQYFKQTLAKHGIPLRHTRLGRPNDNAHIERFNRTLQDECIGYYWRLSVPLHRQRDTLTVYLDFYNQKRVHLGLQMRTPAEMLQRS